MKTAIVIALVVALVSLGIGIYALVRPPEGLTLNQAESMLEEQAAQIREQAQEMLDDLSAPAQED